MYFEVANIEVSVWVPPLAGFLLSFFTSMGGLSGAFLLLPFQVSFLGYVAPSVSATNHVFNIIGIPGGVYRFIKEKRMLWPLVWVSALGTLPGVVLGAVIRVRYLPDPKPFKIFVACVLFYIGFRMLSQLLRARGTIEQGKIQRKELVSAIKVESFSLKRICYTFNGKQFDFGTTGIWLLSCAVGVVGGVYGIGGGVVLVPFFVTVLGLPVYTVAGAALMGTFITSLTAVIFYQVIGFFYPHLGAAPDFMLGFLFGVGGLAGMYCGARLQKFVPAKAIKWMLALAMLFIALKYFFEVF